MPVADEYLRNRASIAARTHFLAKFSVFLDIDLVESHFLLSQQSAGPLAVRTPLRQVQRHRRLGHFEPALPPGEVFANGKLSLTQASMPPCRLNTLVNPSLISV